MARWLFPAVALAVILAAVGIGLFVWTRTGDSAVCDRETFARTLRDGIRTADAQGANTFTVDLPSGCDEQDLELLVPEVTRDWHMMPGGTMMRAARHPGP